MPKQREENHNNFDCFLETTYYTDLNKSYDLSSFCSGIEEYDSFIKEDALNQMELGICHTHLLIEIETKNIIGYFSLCMGAIKLTTEEKENHGLESITYSQCPCLKLGKLAIGREYKRKGYGGFIIEIVKGMALQVNENSVACRLISLDADIQYDKGNIKFYSNCGFIANENPNRGGKTVAMHKDIYAV